MSRLPPVQNLDFCLIGRKTKRFFEPLSNWLHDCMFDAPINGLPQDGGGGGGNPREFDFVRLYLDRDFDVHSDPLGGKFDSVAILESGEGLGTSGHLGKSPEVIWMSFPRFCCAFRNGRTEGKDYLDTFKVKIVDFNTHPLSILKFCNT